MQYVKGFRGETLEALASEGLGDALARLLTSPDPDIMEAANEAWLELDPWDDLDDPDEGDFEARW